MIRLFDEPIATRRHEVLGSISDADAMRAAFTTGDSVSVDKGLTLSAVWRATELTAKVFSTLPCFAYERLERGGKKPVPDDPLYDLVHDDANEELSAVNFREWAMIQALLRGNVYAEIGRNALGDAVRVWPLETEACTPVRDSLTKALYLEVTNADGQKVYLPWRDVFHVPGFLLDPIVGVGVIEKARRNLDLSIKQEEFSRNFYRNGATVGGVVTIPGDKKPEQVKEIQGNFSKGHATTTNAHRTLFMHSGMTYSAREVLSQQDAQWIESRNFSVYDVARWFGLRPSFLMAQDATNYASQEQDYEQLISDTLRPWAVKWENEMRRKFIAPHRRKSIVIEFAIDAVVRGNLSDRAEAYSKLLNAGIVTANECRAKENLPAVEGGDTLRQPLNVIEASKANAYFFKDSPQPQDSIETDREGTSEQQDPVLEPSPSRTTETGDEASTSARVAAVMLLTRANTRMSTVYRQRLTKIGDDATKRAAFVDDFRTKYAAEVRPIVNMLGTRDANETIATLWSEFDAA